MSDPIPRGPFDQGLFLTHFNKGRESFDARRLDDAERQLEEAYLLRPRDVRVLNLLGLVYFRSNKLVKAEEVYRKLVAENPEAPTLHYNLGLICFKLNRLEDAEQAFQKALELTQGNPKIHFYLGSIYERLRRYKDAIYQYRQAGANLMVQRLQGKLATVPRELQPDSTTPPAGVPSVERPPLPEPQPASDGLPPAPVEAEARPTGSEAPTDEPPPPPVAEATAEPAAPPPPLLGDKKVLRPLSPALLAEDRSHLVSTDRFLRKDDTLPPATRTHPLSPAPGSPTATAPPAPAVPSQEAPPPPPREIFRGLERGLMEVDFSGKVFIKQGTIYSYSGTLTFWVKDKRSGGRATLVIVTGTGRLLLTDNDREITFMQVADEPVFVEPAHLLACEETLNPRYLSVGDEATAAEVVVLEGKGMVALSAASKPLPLSVRPGLPASVPASSVIMWTGSLTPHVVDDPQVYEVVLPSAASGGRLLRLEGSGRILVEQAGG